MLRFFPVLSLFCKLMLRASMIITFVSLVIYLLGLYIECMQLFSDFFCRRLSAKRSAYLLPIASLAAPEGRPISNPSSPDLDDYDDDYGSTTRTNLRTSIQHSPAGFACWRSCYHHW